MTTQERSTDQQKGSGRRRVAHDPWSLERGKVPPDWPGAPPQQWLSPWSHLAGGRRHFEPGEAGDPDRVPDERREGARGDPVHGYVPSPPPAPLGPQDYEDLYMQSLGIPLDSNRLKQLSRRLHRRAHALEAMALHHARALRERREGSVDISAIPGAVGYIDPVTHQCLTGQCGKTSVFATKDALDVALGPVHALAEVGESVFAPLFGMRHRHEGADPGLLGRVGTALSGGQPLALFPSGAEHFEDINPPDWALRPVPDSVDMYKIDPRWQHTGFRHPRHEGLFDLAGFLPTFAERFVGGNIGRTAGEAVTGPTMQYQINGEPTTIEDLQQMASDAGATEGAARGRALHADFAIPAARMHRLADAVAYASTLPPDQRQLYLARVRAQLHGCARQVRSIARHHRSLLGEARFSMSGSPGGGANAYHAAKRSSVFSMQHKGGSEDLMRTIGDVYDTAALAGGTMIVAPHVNEIGAAVAGLPMSVVNTANLLGAVRRTGAAQQQQQQQGFFSDIDLMPAAAGALGGYLLTSRLFKMPRREGASDDDDSGGGSSILPLAALAGGALLLAPHLGDIGKGFQNLVHGVTTGSGGAATGAGAGGSSTAASAASGWKPGPTDIRGPYGGINESPTSAYTAGPTVQNPGPGEMSHVSPDIMPGSPGTPGHPMTPPQTPADLEPKPLPEGARREGSSDDDGGSSWLLPAAAIGGALLIPGVRNAIGDALHNIGGAVSHATGAGGGVPGTGWASQSAVTHTNSAMPDDTTVPPTPMADRSKWGYFTGEPGKPLPDNAWSATPGGTPPDYTPPPSGMRREGIGPDIISQFEQGLGNAALNAPSAITNAAQTIGTHMPASWGVPPADIGTALSSSTGPSGVPPLDALRAVGDKLTTSGIPPLDAATHFFGVAREGAQQQSQGMDWLPAIAGAAGGYLLASQLFKMARHEGIPSPSSPDRASPVAQEEEEVAQGDIPTPSGGGGSLSSVAQREVEQNTPKPRSSGGGGSSSRSGGGSSSRSGGGGKNEDEGINWPLVGAVGLGAYLLSHGGTTPAVAGGPGVHPPAVGGPVPAGQAPGGPGIHRHAGKKKDDGMGWLLPAAAIGGALLIPGVRDSLGNLFHGGGPAAASEAAGAAASGGVPPSPTPDTSIPSVHPPAIGGPVPPGQAPGSEGAARYAGAVQQQQQQGFFSDIDLMPAAAGALGGYLLSSRLFKMPRHEGSKDEDGGGGGSDWIAPAALGAGAVYLLSGGFHGANGPGPITGIPPLDIFKNIGNALHGLSRQEGEKEGGGSDWILPAALGGGAMLLAGMLGHGGGGGGGINIPPPTTATGIPPVDILRQGHIFGGRHEGSSDDDGIGSLLLPAAVIGGGLLLAPHILPYGGGGGSFHGGSGGMARPHHGQKGVMSPAERSGNYGDPRFGARRRREGSDDDDGLGGILPLAALAGGALLLAPHMGDIGKGIGDFWHNLTGGGATPPVAGGGLPPGTPPGTPVNPPGGGGPVPPGQAPGGPGLHRRREGDTMGDVVTLGALGLGAYYLAPHMGDIGRTLHDAWSSFSQGLGGGAVAGGGASSNFGDARGRALMSDADLHASYLDQLAALLPGGRRGVLIPIDTSTPAGVIPGY